ncbi:MAG TPA: isopentenyl-diphosphate Delta-isomerase [Rhodothermales bacterium]
MHDLVTLVDSQDRVVGTAGKLEAHREALLHRACSVVLFNRRGEILLQQRSREKYHSGGLWSNTCCTHPRPDEEPLAAASRRLTEEMGLTCALEPAFAFLYRAELDGGLVEHEYDHVFVGRADADPRPDSREVSAWRWQHPDAVRRDLDARPETFTAWFAPLFRRLETSPTSGLVSPEAR